VEGSAASGRYRGTLAPSNSVFWHRRPSNSYIESRAALDSRQASLRRDECGDWAIFGQHGHVYAVPECFQLFAFKQSVRGWSAARSRLGFCEVTQDADEEGGFILNRLPSESEATAIRYVLDIPKAKHLSQENCEKLIAAGAKGRFKAGFIANPQIREKLFDALPRYSIGRAPRQRQILKMIFEHIINFCGRLAVPYACFQSVRALDTVRLSPS